MGLLSHNLINFQLYIIIVRGVIKLKDLEKIRKRIKIESSMNNDIRYYTFLLDMFKYGIILDDMQELINKLNDIEINLSDSHSVINEIMNSKEIIPIKIELFDLLTFDYDDPPANIEVILVYKCNAYKY